MHKVRQRDKGASIERKYKLFVKTDTKIIVEKRKKNNKRNARSEKYWPMKDDWIISPAKHINHEIKPLHKSKKK